MIIPKELYIDSFNFIPIRKEDKIETLICDVFNNDVNLIILNNLNLIDFRHSGDTYSDYNFKTNSFWVNYFKIMNVLGPEYINKPEDELNKLFVPILKRHFKFNVKSIY